MLAAEQANQFTYKGESSKSEPEVPTASTEVVTNRLLDLYIGKTIPPSAENPTAPEKTTKSTVSSSRPLTLDDDDLDLDLEIDDTIDTTVSLIISVLLSLTCLLYLNHCICNVLATLSGIIFCFLM